MSELEQLQQIKVDVQNIRDSMQALDQKFTYLESMTTVQIPAEVNVDFSNIVTSLVRIVNWVDSSIQAIEEGEQPEVPLSVIEQFLQELKLVFEKYSASIEVKSGEAYGESWGGADVLEFTATLDGVTEKKTIALDNSILTAEDM